MTRVPAGWTVCAIGDVLQPVEKTGKNEADRVISYIDISSIDNESNRITAPKRMNLSDAPSRARQKIRSGDVLFATVRPYLRNIARVEPAFDGEIASTGFAVLRGAPGVDPRYLFYKSISHDFVSALTGEQYGVSYPAVKEDQVKEQRLELPPTLEQGRIVEKIEALFDEIDRGVDSLRGAQKAIALYRQSLLRSAFEGRLTAQWRAENPDKLENPGVLLARIRAEHETRDKAALEDWERDTARWKAEGEQGKKPQRPRPTVAPSIIPPSEADRLPPIPREWAYTKLANLGDLGRGRSTHRPRNDPRLFGGSYPFIQTGEVKAAGRSITTYRQTYSDAGLAQSKLWPVGTLCITIAANIAETAFLTFEACFPDSIVGFSASDDIVAPAFVELFIKSTRTEIEAYAPATAQKNINLLTLETLATPLCGRAEQAELIRLLDERLDSAEMLQAEIDASLSRADALRESILKNAFAGQLVPQDPTDEPASTLLARIRTEWDTKRSKRSRRRVEA